MQNTLLKNFNLFLSGQGYAGQIEQLSLPKLTLKTEDFQMGGLDIPIKMDMGMEPMSCEMTLVNYDKNMISGFGKGVGRHSSNELKKFHLKGACQPQSLAALNVDASNRHKPTDIVPLNIILTGTWQSLDFGTWKQGDVAKLVASINVRYYQLKLGDDTLVEIDVDNMTRKIMEKDRLSTLRPYL